MFPGSDPQKVIGSISVPSSLFLHRGCPVARLGGPKIMFYHSSPSACIYGQNNLVISQILTQSVLLQNQQPGFLT